MGVKLPLLLALVLVATVGVANALIIPEELPSLLSIIYSNIPPIKNGFDTRFGIGFRLGQHADVQLLTEVGPQTETDKLGETERRRYANSPPSVQETMRREMALAQRKQPQEEQEQDQDQDNWLVRWQKSTLKRQR